MLRRFSFPHFSPPLSLSFSSPAGYSKELLAAGIQSFPHGLQHTTHGTHTGHLHDSSVKPSSTTQTRGIKLEKSNILLLGPTGCGMLIVVYQREQNSKYSYTYN